MGTGGDSDDEPMGTPTPEDEVEPYAIPVWIFPVTTAKSLKPGNVDHSQWNGYYPSSTTAAPFKFELFKHSRFHFPKYLCWFTFVSV